MAEKQTVMHLTPVNLLAILLTVLFVGLKLAGIIDWAWWLVLLPLWGGITLVGLLLGIAALLIGLGVLLTGEKKSKGH